jgi:hypothetical protein
MAKEQEQTVSVNDLASAFSAALASVKPAKVIAEGDPEYTERLKAEGFYDFFDNNVKVYQNAYEAQPRGLSEEVRYRAAHLRPGSYIKNRVKVTVENDGAVVRLAYPVSGDAMLINRDYFSSFSDLVNKIWDEMHATVAA